MRFSVQLPTDRVESGDFTSVEAVRELAGAAERAGFDACYVTEHPFPTDEWLDSGGGHHALDPFVALAAAAAVTSRLRLHTNILVLPYRNPFLTAKALASLDVLSGGRVIAGIAVGYLEGEYRALGADLQHRNELAQKVRWLGDHAREIGRREPLDVNFVPFGLGMNTRKALDPHAIREQVKQLGEAGVTWLSVGLPGRTRGEYCEDLSRFGEEVIAWAG